jgi:hypothetical protein
MLCDQLSAWPSVTFKALDHNNVILVPTIITTIDIRTIQGYNMRHLV